MQGCGPTSTNREWSGDRLSASDFLREAVHVKDAHWQVDAVYDAYGCSCHDCERSGRSNLDGGEPEVAELERYSHLALGFTASIVFHVDVPHDHRPPLTDWVHLLQLQHARARDRRADQVDHDQMLLVRGQSAKPPVRWMGRSPRHNG